MSVSLRQLADRLDVAPSTVSRALAGQPGSSKARAREIRELATKLGYRPRPLRRKVNRTLGLLIASSAHANHDPDAYQLDLMSQAMAVVGEADWHLHSERVFADHDELPRLVADNRVDGLILCQHPSPALCRKIRELEMPAVALDDTVERTGLSCVIADVAPATAQVVRRLCDMGHRHIAMVATPDQFPTVRRRIEGFRQGLFDAGLKPDDRSVVRAGYSTIQQGQVATRQLLDRPDRPTAIVFATDRLALGGMIEITRAGLRVPYDISIVGHDNTALARELDPALTSVDLNLSRSITMAFEHVKAMIHNRMDELDGSTGLVQLEVESQVIWRGSCAPAG